jgi:hypothetical protein
VRGGGKRRDCGTGGVERGGDAGRRGAGGLAGDDRARTDAGAGGGMRGAGARVAGADGKAECGNGLVCGLWGLKD